MTRSIRSIAVFCGSNAGKDQVYREAATALGIELAASDIELVYGGTHVGLMGVLADAVIGGGGRAYGVITERLHAKGHLHEGLTLHETAPDMRSRKARMLQLADACIALPGGIGTMEEFMEAWTLNQLGDIDKPVGLLDINGFFAALLAFLDNMVAERFLPREHREALAVASNPAALIDLLKAHTPPTVPKWL